MKDKDINELRKEFEELSAKDGFCADGGCKSDEELDIQDYPSFTDALYAKLVAPYESGIYISRWDIKNIADAAGDSMAIQPRKRMFEMLMKYASNKENMQSVLNALDEHMKEKVNIYQEFVEKFPSTAEVFDPKIAKAERTMKFFPQILDEYFGDNQLY